MPDLLIRIKKKTDGTAALSCTRPDGSVTWQRQDGAQGRFFPVHDLTHYAVETVLGHRRGFFGLVAEGWDLGDFGKPWPRGPIPAAALHSELVVGFLDAERAGGVRWTAADVNEKVAGYCSQHGIADAFSPVTDGQLDAIHVARGDLFARWRALPAGETLELEFTRG
jgi:hypothetical protein